MKILLVSNFYPPYFIGGDSIHVKYLRELLVEKGHSVEILTNGDAERATERAKICSSPEKTRGVIRIKTKFWLIRLFCAKFLGFGYKRIVEPIILKNKYDVVHFHNIDLFGQNLLKISHINKIITLHDDYWLNKKFRNDVKVICPSMHIYKKVNSSRKYYVPNFVPFFHKKEKNEDYYLYSGVLERHKGIIDLIKVFNKAGKRLFICGDGKLRKYVVRHKKPNISYFGRLSHKKNIEMISKCKALVLPSYKENCPLVILEALSLKKPVIARDIPQIKEITKDNLFRNNAEFEMLLDNPKKGLLAERFTKEKFYEKYIKLISRRENA